MSPAEQQQQQQRKKIYHRTSLLTFTEDYCSALSSGFLNCSRTNMKTQVFACIAVLIAFLATSEGMSLGVELHCRCIQTESKPIGRHIEKVELIPANSHCEETEIIATLKKTGQEVCLDPEAPWVKRVIQKIMSSRRR